MSSPCPANAGQTLLGRKVNRDSHLPPSLITAVSTAAGAAALLTTGVTVERVPHLPPRAWLIVGWLTVTQVAGLILAGAGVLWVQLARMRRTSHP